MAQCSKCKHFKPDYQSGECSVFHSKVLSHWRACRKYESKTYEGDFDDELDEYLFENHQVKSGCCSSVENLKYQIAREVAEKMIEEFDIDIQNKKCTLMDKKMRKANKKIADAQKYIYNLLYGEHKSIWHNEDEEPQRGSLILLIMQSGTPVVAKIIEPNHTFNHGERWAYIDDLLEKQGNGKDIHLLELKAKAYDDAKERMSYAYNQNRVPIGFISEIFPNLNSYEKQSEQKPADKVESKFHKGEWITIKE